MFYLFSLLNGILVAISVFFNGQLNITHGLHLSTVIVHISGLIFITLIVLVKRENPFTNRQKWYFYIGGAVGIFIIMFNNIAFARIGVSAILALLLLGKSIVGLVVDQTGWLGMPKSPFRKNKIIGLVVITSGIGIMLIGRLDFLAVILSLLAGAAIIIGRTLNAKLAEATNPRKSTFFNYLIGFAFSIPVYLVLTGQGVSAELANFTFSPNIYIYLGGILGVCFITISNVLVLKIPAFYLSLFLFVGQALAGVLLDTFIAGFFPFQIFAGAVLVAIGLCIDLIFEKRSAGTPKSA